RQQPGVSLSIDHHTILKTDAHSQNARFAGPDLDHVKCRRSDPRVTGAAPGGFLRYDSPAHLRVRSHLQDRDTEMFSSAYETNQTRIVDTRTIIRNAVRTLYSFHRGRVRHRTIYSGQ